MQNLVIIRLISTKANSYSNFITCSPSLCRTLVVLSINTFWWAPFVVQLTLTALELLQSFCGLFPTYFFALNLSYPAHAALRR